MPGALLVDLYELTMAQSLFAERLHERPGTFSLFCRTLPKGWNYLLAAGLDDVLSYLEGLRFAEDELEWLEESGRFTGDFLDYLRGFRFSGAVRAMPEGTAFFPLEPVLEVDAPFVEGQIVESVLLNQIHVASLLASKAARCVDVARGRTLVDFSLRRTHGTDAAMKVARSSYIAGFDATSNVEAGRRWEIPISGTMAHSFVEAFDDEEEAFRAFARSYPDASVFLVDTYDTEAGVERAAAVGRELAERGRRLVGVRLDSGDLAMLARRAREILDAAGLEDTSVFVSGGLDEDDIEELLAEGAPIGGFGIGTKMGVSADAPFLDLAYKLVSFDGRPTLKLSRGKASLPGPKQVWRSDDDGCDTLGRADEELDGEPLLVSAMEGGRRTIEQPLADARERAARRRPYELRVSDALAELRDAVTARLA